MERVIDNALLFSLALVFIVTEQELIRPVLALLHNLCGDGIIYI